MEKDKVLIEKEFLPRCDWCGTYYSPQWIRIKYGRVVYCSQGCAVASTTETDDVSVMVWNRLSHVRGLRLLYGSLIFLSFILLFTFPLQAVIWISLQLFSFCCLIADFQSTTFRENMRKGLERKDLYRDSQPIELECAYCSHLNPPNTLECGHCGSSLKDSRSIEGTIPEWFQSVSDSTKSVCKCPHCGAAYLYKLPEEEGVLNCHNCGKSFSPES